MHSKCYIFLVLLLLFNIKVVLASETSTNGLLEIRYGYRENNTEGQKRTSINELKIQLNTESEFDELVFNLSLDLKSDAVDNEHSIDLNSGEGNVDLRQFNVLFYPSDNIDIKVGRQILTWGTTDLLFINDLFPKDFKSFFIGRTEGYLKAPSDAIKISFFPKIANFDLVYIPKFNADRFVTGERISFYDPILQDFRTSNNPIITKNKSDWFNDDELAMRVTKNIEGLETALYYYKGFWKSPSFFDIESELWEFSNLEVTGASIRTAFSGGIFNAEIGRYKSDSLSKNNPFSRNSELRFLLGFEKELLTELTASLQYYTEKKLNYSNYLNSLPELVLAQPKRRRLVSLMMTKLMLQQNLTLSLVNIYSFTEKDGYIKLNASYKFSDRFKSDVGWNQFFGSGDESNFSGLKRNNNWYAGVSYTF